MVYRMGSRGRMVMEIQSFLGAIDVDGIFGPQTEDAVKTFQKVRGLVVDGIVGPKTLEAMSLLDTDLTVDKAIDSKFAYDTHYLPAGEYLNGPTTKEYAFLHFTAGWHNPYKCIDHWGRDSRGRIATEFVLGGPSIKGDDDTYDGRMVQAFPSGAYAWHIGRNGSQYMHEHSVGLEICNWGYLKGGKTWAGVKADPSQIVTLAEPFKGMSQWHRFSDAQIEQVREWLYFIAERDGIDIREGLPRWIKKEGAKAFEWKEEAYRGLIKGVLSHTNTNTGKCDIHPQQEMMDMLVSL